MTETDWILRAGAVAAALYSIYKAIAVAGAKASKAFARGVDEHVKPLVEQVTVSINGVTESVRDIRRDHQYEIASIRSTLADHRTELDDHEERIRGNRERIATLEGAAE